MRKFPKKGYYVWNGSKFDRDAGPEFQGFDNKVEPVNCSNPKFLSVTYCSGGTKGNFYWHPEFHGEQWNALLWTCVMSVKDAELWYDYHETNPINVAPPGQE